MEVPNYRHYGRNMCVPMLTPNFTSNSEEGEKVLLDSVAIPCNMLLANGVTIDPRKISKGVGEYGDAGWTKKDVFTKTNKRFQLEIGTRSTAFDIIYHSDYDTPVYPFLNKIFEPLATLTPTIAFQYIEIEETKRDFWVDFHRLTSTLTSNMRAFCSIVMTHGEGDRVNVKSCPPFGANFILQQKNIGELFQIVFAKDEHCDFLFPVIVPRSNLDDIKSMRNTSDPIWYYINIFKMVMFEMAATWILDTRNTFKTSIEKVWKVNDILNDKLNVPFGVTMKKRPKPVKKKQGKRNGAEYDVDLENDDVVVIEPVYNKEAKTGSIKLFVSRFGDIIPVLEHKPIENAHIQHCKLMYNTLIAHGNLRTNIDVQALIPDPSLPGSKLLFRSGNDIFRYDIGVSKTLDPVKLISDICKYDDNKWYNGARWIYYAGHTLTVSKAMHGIACVNRWYKDEQVMWKVIEKTIHLLMISNSCGVWGLKNHRGDIDYNFVFSSVSTLANPYGSYYYANSVLYPFEKLSYLYGSEYTHLRTTASILISPWNYLLNKKDKRLKSFTLAHVIQNNGEIIVDSSAFVKNKLMVTFTMSAPAIGYCLKSVVSQTEQYANMLVSFKAMFDTFKSSNWNMEEFYKNYKIQSTNLIVDQQRGGAEGLTIALVDALAAMKKSLTSAELNVEDKWTIVTRTMLQMMYNSRNDSKLSKNLIEIFNQWLNDPFVIDVIKGGDDDDDAWYGDILSLDNRILFKPVVGAPLFNETEIFELQKILAEGRTELCDELVKLDPTNKVSRLICPETHYPHTTAIITFLPQTTKEVSLLTLPIRFTDGIPKNKQSGFEIYTSPISNILNYLSLNRPHCWVITCVPLKDWDELQKITQKRIQIKDQQISRSLNNTLQDFSIEPGRLKITNATLIHNIQSTIDTYNVYENTKETVKSVVSVIAVGTTIGLPWWVTYVWQIMTAINPLQQRERWQHINSLANVFGQ